MARDGCIIGAGVVGSLNGKYIIFCNFYKKAKRFLHLGETLNVKDLNEERYCFILYLGK